jgi:hypothetical protein
VWILNPFLAFPYSCPIFISFLEKLLAGASDIEVEDEDKDKDCDEECEIEKHRYMWIS